MAATDDNRTQSSDIIGSQHNWYNLLFNYANDAIFVYQRTPDGDPGNMIDVNQAACRMLGYSKEELLEMTMLDITSPERYTNYLDFRNKLDKSGHIITETVKVAKDGTKIHTELSSHLFKIDGVPTVLSIVRDITDRKKIEDDLRESQNRYHTLLDMAYDGILLYKMGSAHERGRFVEANKTICQRLGYTRAEMLKLSPLQITHTEDPNFINKMRERFRQSGGFTFNHIELTKDGRRIPTETTVKLLKIKGERYILITSRDISERVKTEKQRKEDEERYRALFNSMNDGIIVHETSANGLVGKITEVNDKACRMLGYSREQLLGISPIELIKPNDRPKKMPSHYSQLLKEGSSFYETDLESADGTRIPVEISSYLLERHGSLYVVAVIRDISQRIEAEQQIREARERLIRNEKLAALGQMASGIAHDIGTPLTVITNVADYLREQLGNANEMVSAQLERLERQANIACKIAHDLLDFARVRLPNLDKVPIANIVQDAFELVYVPHDIEVLIEHEDDACTITADQEQIARVITNMISNAIKSMPDGGMLQVRTRQAGDDVLIEIADTGMGIKAGNMEKIFEPLFTTHSREGNTGIGLAICKSIVEAHNGVIEVKSKEGEGTTFIIKLPDPA